MRAAEPGRPSRWEPRLARRGGAVELLRLPALLFGAVVVLRRTFYDRGWLPRERVDVPVVSVGNLSAGGTGKTPMCVWLARELERRGLRPGFLSRGFGRDAEHGSNEEARLLARLCPDVAHVQDAQRVRGARALCERGVDVIVLDDGFQHRSLARDLDLVLIDATRPWGLPVASVAHGVRGEHGAFGEHGEREPVCALLPRGFLREPRSSLARADAIVITRADQLEPERLAALERELAQHAPGRPILRACHRARAWRDERGRERALDALRGAQVDLVSAIGNPQAFEESVRASGALVASHRILPDHHHYVAADLEGLGGADRTLVTTAKDAVKLAQLGRPFQALEVELELLSGAHVLEALLDALSTGRRAHERRALHAGLHG